MQSQSNLKILLQRNFLLLIKLLKNTFIAQDIMAWHNVHDDIILEFKSKKKELSCQDTMLLFDGLTINLAISIYNTKLSKDIAIEDIELFLVKLKTIKTSMFVDNKFSYFIIFNIIDTLLNLEKMIIRFKIKFNETFKLLGDKQRISFDQFNTIVAEHTKNIYNDAAELLLNPNYKRYDDLQLLIHRFKRYIKIIIANSNYPQEEVMYNRNNYVVGQQPGHYLGAVTSARELQCDCGVGSLLLLFKRVFVSDANNNKPVLTRNNNSNSSFSSSDTLVSSVYGHDKTYTSNSTGDGLSSDDSSPGYKVNSNHFYRLLRS